MNYKRLKDYYVAYRCIDLTIARSIHQGRGLRFPCNDRTDEVNRLFIIWPF